MVTRCKWESVRSPASGGEGTHGAIPSDAGELDLPERDIAAIARRARVLADPAAGEDVGTLLADVLESEEGDPEEEGDADEEGEGDEVRGVEGLFAEGTVLVDGTEDDAVQRGGDDNC